MNKMNVLMVGPGRNVMGGISTVVNSYYELGLDKKINLTYVASMKDGNKLKKLWIAFQSYLKFCKELKRNQIVHVHMAAQASFVRKSVFIKKAHQKGKKIIIHQHSADFDDYYLKQCNEKQKKKIRDVFSMADHVIVLSEEWMNFFADYICEEDKISVLHNGVIISDYAKTDYSDHNVLFLGRLGKRKGTYDLLDSIPGVIEQIPDAKFYLGGDGDIEKCRKIAQEKNIDHYIEFLGWVKDEEKEKYLKKCSTFVLPSYHEGMPMSVLEAMNYGLAVISTNVGGIPQVITDGIDGFCLKPGDIRESTQCMIRVLSEQSLRKKIGNSAKNKIIQSFNAELNIKRLIELYQKMEQL